MKINTLQTKCQMNTGMVIEGRDFPTTLNSPEWKLFVWMVYFIL